MGNPETNRRPRPPGRSTAAAGTPVIALPETAGLRVWDGRILERIVDLVEAMGESGSPEPTSGFAPTDWSQRNFVRINGSDKSRISFPFFHATTSSEWVVTLRFFVPKNTFREDALEKQLDLVPFHESETPVLCDLPRLRVAECRPVSGDHDRGPRLRRI